MSELKGFTTLHINEKLFKEILKGINKEATLKSWSPNVSEQKLGFVSGSLEKNDMEEERMVGLFSYQLVYTLPKTEKTFQVKVMIKSKPRYHELIDSFTKLIPASETEYINLYKMYADQLEFGNTDYKELECVKVKDKVLKSVMPDIYWHWIDPSQDIFVFAMEYLEPVDISHFDTINDIHLWKEDDIFAVLDGLAFFHARFYNQYSSLPASLRKYVSTPYIDRLTDFTSLWKVCADSNLKTGFWTKKHHDLYQVLANNLQHIQDRIAQVPKTLIHNDVNVMNVCLRRNPKQGKLRVCLYDWELCGWGPVQRDIALFLNFVLPEKTVPSKWHYYIEHYHLFLMKHLQTFNQQPDSSLELSNFKKVFDMCICETYIGRHSWITSIFAQAYNPPFIPRVFGNLVQYVTHVAEEYNFS